MSAEIVKWPRQQRYRVRKRAGKAIFPLELNEAEAEIALVERGISSNAIDDKRERAKALAKLVGNLLRAEEIEEGLMLMIRAIRKGLSDV